MTPHPLPTTREYISHWEEAEMDEFETYNRQDIEAVFGNLSDPAAKANSRLAMGPAAKKVLVISSVGLAATGLAVAAGLLAPLALGAAIIVSAATLTGTLSSQVEKKIAQNKAGDLHESLRANWKNATSMEDLIKGQQDLIAKNRKDNEDNPNTTKEALGKQAVFLGVIACGMIGSLGLLASAPVVAAAVITLGTIQVGEILGEIHGQVVGEQKTDNMMNRIAERTKSFEVAIAARRQTETGPLEAMGPSRLNNSF